MKTIGFYIVVFFITTHQSIAQISISTEKYNALKEIKEIPTGMTYEEFVKIQRELNWKRIMVSAVIPGYLHFYTGRKTEAWSILGVRLAGGLLMGYAMLDQYRLTKEIDTGIIVDSEEESERTEKNSIYLPRD